MQSIKTSSGIVLAILSGLLFWIAWTPNNFSAAIFFAFIPLLVIEEKETRGLRCFLFIYTGLFTWNLLTTWWIWNSTMIGAWLAIAVNSLLMYIPWWGYRKIKKQFSPDLSLVALFVFWLSFEYLHQLDWGLSWPWLTIGNALAERTSWIQWYEFTGTSGGTAWIFGINLLLYRFYIHPSGLRLPWYKHWIMTGGFLLPVLFSLWIQEKEEKLHEVAKKTTASKNIVILQPNIDPYEKISSDNLKTLTQHLVDQSKKLIDSNTTLLVWPETALYTAGGINENTLIENTDVQPLFKLLNEYPKLHLFSGIESYRIFPEKHSVYSRPIDESGNYYEVYNAAVLMDHTGVHQYYHKSMLVPGVETLPKFLLFLGPLFEQLGGTAGGYARQEIRTPVPVKDHYMIAPAICYESIYGEFLSEYIKKGSNLIVIITNDGWWGNTPGHQQHLAYARLRAIETRKWVVRSANTGISTFINPHGEKELSSTWWKEDVIKQSVYTNQRVTLFVQWGDWISKMALVLTSFIFIIYLSKKIRSNRTR